MSVLSYQINQACSTNPDLPMCMLLDTVAPIVVVIFAILFPIAFYSLLKQERFKSGDWTKKLAYISGLSFVGIFLIGSSLQILKYISDSLPIFNYALYSLVGTAPLLFKHPEVLASLYPKESAEINSWSTSQKNVVAICVLALLISAVVLFINR
ncbi:MAG: hypothetical protein WC069_00565 [Candidatus Shapirobacteria bacterium]